MSRFDESLDRVEVARASITRALIKGEIDGFELLEINREFDQLEQKIKSRRLAVMLSMKERKE